MMHKNQMENRLMRMREVNRMQQGKGNQQVFSLRDSKGVVKLVIPPISEKSAVEELSIEF